MIPKDLRHLCLLLCLLQILTVKLSGQDTQEHHGLGRSEQTRGKFMVPPHLHPRPWHSGCTAANSEPMAKSQY